MNFWDFSDEQNKTHFNDVVSKYSEINNELILAREIEIMNSACLIALYFVFFCIFILFYLHSSLNTGNIKYNFK